MCEAQVGARAATAVGKHLQPFCTTLQQFCTMQKLTVYSVCILDSYMHVTQSVFQLSMSAVCCKKQRCMYKVGL